MRRERILRFYDASCSLLKSHFSLLYYILSLQSKGLFDILLHIINRINIMEESTSTITDTPSTPPASVPTEVPAPETEHPTGGESPSAQ